VLRAPGRELRLLARRRSGQIWNTVIVFEEALHDPKGLALSEGPNAGCYRLLSPIGMIGYGIVERSFALGVAARPDVIGVDGGSVDPGPYYLGSGCCFTSRELVTRDARLCLRAGRELGIPLVIGTAGGAGGEPHLAFAFDCIRDAAKAESLGPLRLVLIHAEQPAQLVSDWLEAGRLRSFPGAPVPSREGIAASERIVGQMGVATIERALELEPDVVLAGRASDVAIFAGPAVHAGGDPALAIHLGKVMECGAHCAEPASGRDAMLAELYEDHFVLRPPNPERRCTAQGVAAHMLYENAHPFRLAEPDGICDLSDVVVESCADRGVRVSGANFEPAERMTVKLEGSAQIGYRAIVMGGMRDPRLIAEVDHVIRVVEEAVAASFGDEDYELSFRVYGRDGVLGPSEPETAAPREVGLLCEALAPTAAFAHAVAQAAEAALITAPYPNGISATGNLAVPYSPLITDVGPAYEWSVFCLAEADDEESLFPLEVVEI
jgi:hypothetical protein